MELTNFLMMSLQSGMEFTKLIMIILQIGM